MSKYATYEIDHGAVRQAADELGITWPIRLRRHYLINWSGYYLGPYRAGDPHLILVSSLVDPVGASRTLWHELQHAADLEAEGCPRRFGVRLTQEYADAGVPYGGRPRGDTWQAYRAMPLERRAIAAEAHHDRLPLTWRI